MISYIKRKLKKIKLKKTFKEYGYKVKMFSIEKYGNVEYAQWLHPFESKKQITKSQIDFFGQFIKPGDFAIDIGAHTGDTTVPMAIAVGKQGKILALEPNPYVFKILEENAKLNTNSGVIIPIPFAATDTEGEFTFNYSDASFCNGGYLEKIKNNKHNHNYQLKIKGINLQDFLLKSHSEDLDRLTLIKVDAEGYDKEIIKTLSKIIETYHPCLLAECYKRLNKEERQDLFQTISSLGYKLFRINEFEENTTYTLLTNDLMSQEKHFEILAVHSDNELLLQKIQ